MEWTPACEGLFRIFKKMSQTINMVCGGGFRRSERIPRAIDWWEMADNIEKNPADEEGGDEGNEDVEAEAQVEFKPLIEVS
jgi:hypothetical protein